MSMVAPPSGDVYQAGTLSGNPLAMKMGHNVISYLEEHPEVYEQLELKAQRLRDGFALNLEKLEISDVTINRVGGMICQFLLRGGQSNPMIKLWRLIPTNTASTFEPC